MLELPLYPATAPQVSTAPEPATAPQVSTAPEPATAPPRDVLTSTPIIVSPNVDIPTSQCNQQNNSGFSVSPCDVLPIPKAQDRPIRKTGPKKGSSGILTLSPYIDELKKVKKRPTSQPKQSKKKKRASPRTLFSETPSTSTSNASNPECFYCNEMYSKSKAREGWIRCSQCHKWAHDECAGVEDEDDDFECEICLARRLTANRS
uniref:Zinc finger PHD-type domain-containing protein n=1 Tax=Cacopsylla melanoneura TaxID=428564 RepID=A0A8D9B3W5_9HEMI